MSNFCVKFMRFLLNIATLFCLPPPPAIFSAAVAVSFKTVIKIALKYSYLSDICQSCIHLCCAVGRCCMLVAASHFAGLQLSQLPFCQFSTWVTLAKNFMETMGFVFPYKYTIHSQGNHVIDFD